MIRLALSLVLGIVVGVVLASLLTRIVLVIVGLGAIGVVVLLVLLRTGVLDVSSLEEMKVRIDFPGSPQGLLARVLDNMERYFWTFLGVLLGLVAGMLL